MVHDIPMTKSLASEQSHCCNTPWY